MKKLFALSLSLIMTLSLLSMGCQKKEEVQKPAETEAPAVEAPATEAPATKAPATAPEQAPKATTPEKAAPEKTEGPEKKTGGY